MSWLFPFILGWWGSRWGGRNWWPGIEVDAPPPGGGDPWWGLVAGIVGGVAAIVIVPLAGEIADPVTGALLAIGSGAVGAHVIGALLGAFRGKRT